MQRDVTRRGREEDVEARAHNERVDWEAALVCRSDDSASNLNIFLLDGRGDDGVPAPRYSHASLPVQIDI
jgi:hypothetical protein